MLRLAPFTEREIRTAVNTTVRLIETAATFETLAPISGPWTAWDFGTRIACLGDLDGDGRDDFAVSAPEEPLAAPEGGVVRVYLARHAADGR